jgi:hypothetical protein
VPEFSCKVDAVAQGGEVAAISRLAWSDGGDHIAAGKEHDTASDGGDQIAPREFYTAKI